MTITTSGLPSSGEKPYYTKFVAWLTTLVAAVNGKATIADGSTSAATAWSSQKVADFVNTALAALVDSSPAALDTLNELAAALGDDPNAVATLNTAIGNRLRFDAAQTLTTAQRDQVAANGGLIRTGQAATTAQGAKADTAVQPAAIANMVTSPNSTVTTIERHASQAAIPTPYALKRVYLVPDAG